MKINARLLLVGTALFLVLIMSACSPSEPPPNLQRTVQVPQGYHLVDASSYGEVLEFETLYCAKNGTERIFVCTNNTIGDELVFPQGYRFLTVSEYGKVLSFKKYYCENISTGEVRICVPLVRSAS